MGRAIVKEKNRSVAKMFTDSTAEHLNEHATEFKAISVSDDFEFLSVNPDDNFFASVYFSTLKKLPFEKMKIKTKIYSTPLYIYLSDTWFLNFPEYSDFILFWVSDGENFNSKDCIATFYLDIGKDHEVSLISNHLNNYHIEDEEKIDYIVNASINMAIEVVDYINSPKTTIHKEKARPLNVLAKPQKRSNDVIYINKREYTYNEPSDNEKREYEHHVKECSVRGHWRRYRNEKGEVIKKIWIEPHKRTFDDGAEENNKIYKI